MAKKNPVFSLAPLLPDQTAVNSKRYGKHTRAPRGTIKPVVLNDTFQKSVSLNKGVNALAKVIKDALDPFRAGFKDGSMWSRLISTLKKHMLKHPSLDLRILEDFELHEKFKLYRHYGVKGEVIIEKEPSARIVLTSFGFSSLEKFKVKQYEQTLIVVFLDANMKATTRSERVRLSVQQAMQYNPLLKKECLTSIASEHMVQWPLPAGTKWILVAARCEPHLDGKAKDLMKLMGMKVVRVVGTGF